MIILARLLSPLDFGILGLAMLSINVLNVFAETGIESALIQRDKIGSAELNTAWTISIIRGSFLFLILFISARWFAFYFSNSTLEPVLKLMAVIFLVGGFVNVGLVYLQRELAFKKIVSLNLVSDITGAVATVMLALWLRNVWALVIGNIVWAIAKCIGSYSLHSYRPKFLWDWSVAKDLLNFGKHIFWISIVTFIVTSGDDALVGKLLGLTALGFYTMAYNIANTLVTSLSGIIGKILFPTFSILQNQPQRLAEAFGRVIEFTLIFLLPFTVLIILLAEDFTLIFLGEKWLPMVPIIKILSLLGFFRGLTNVFSPIQLAVNRPQIQSRNKTIELFLFLLLVYPLTARWGLIGASWAVTTVYMAGAIISALSCASIVPSFFNMLLKAFWIPLLASFGIIISRWLVHSWLNAAGGLTQFLLSVSSGLIVLGVIVFSLRKNLLRTIVINIQEAKA
jgi:O-antigen/teichoic acid export membrane protein